MFLIINHDITVSIRYLSIIIQVVGHRSLEQKSDFLFLAGRAKGKGLIERLIRERRHN